MSANWTPGAPWGDSNAAFRRLVHGNPNGVQTRQRAKRRPHIFKRSGMWWVKCKHGDRTGPYRTLPIAMLAANRIFSEPSA